MKLDGAGIRLAAATEAGLPEAPLTQEQSAKRAEHKVRFSAALGRAKGECTAAAAGEPAETADPEPVVPGKPRRKRTSGAPVAIAAFAVIASPETKLALLPAIAPPAAKAAAPATVLEKVGPLGAAAAATTKPLLGAESAPEATPAATKKFAKTQLDVLEVPLSPREAAPSRELEPRAAEPASPREPSAPRATPAPPPKTEPQHATSRAPVPEANRLRSTTEPEPERVAENPRAVRSATTAARPVVAMVELMPPRDPAAVAVKPEAMPALPRELVEATPLLTAANLAQAVVTLPDLGRIEIRSRMRNGALEVDLRADRAEGRAALENARGALTAQVVAIAPVAQIVVGPIQPSAPDAPLPGHEGTLSDPSRQSGEHGGREPSGGSRERGRRPEETPTVAHLPRGRVRIVL